MHHSTTGHLLLSFWGVSCLLVISGLNAQEEAPLSHRKLNVCVTDIRDPDVPLRPVIDGIEGAEDYLETAHDLLSNVPSLETCVSNFSPLLVANEIIQELLPCVGEVLPFWRSAEIQDLKDNFLNLDEPSLTSINDFLRFLKETADPTYGSVCPDMVNIVNKCINRAVPVLFFYLREESEGCCNEFFEIAESKVGDPGPFLVQLIQHLVSTFCTVRAPGFDNMEAQYCGYTFVQMFLGESTLNMVSTIAPLLTMPNTEACLAFTGQSFLSSLGSKGTLPQADIGRAYGSCAVPLDGLFSFFADLPYTQSQPELKSLFATGESLNGRVIYDKVIEYIPSEWTEDLWLSLIMAVVEQLNFHLPNHFSEQCTFADYVGTLTYDPYPEITHPTPAPPPNVPPIPDPIVTPPPPKNTENSAKTRSIPWSLIVVTLLFFVTV